ncbi:MAG: hypothetical protein ACI808_003358 [Paraglaciecola sp.]|jgi:hypothetical protein
MVFNYKEMYGGSRDVKVVLKRFNGFDFQLRGYELRRYQAVGPC